MRKLRLFFYFPFYFFHLVFISVSRNKSVILADVGRYIKTGEASIWDVMYYMTLKKEFRNIFYMRIGWPKRFLNFFMPEMESLCIGGLTSNHVGEGLLILHGVGIVINKNAVLGKNCTILQNVTIGDREGRGVPKIGNNVLIGAGAMVLGGVEIGDDVRIGAGSIVLTDIPKGSTVVGCKATII